MPKFQILNERRFPLKTIDSADIGRMPNWKTNDSINYKDLLPFWRWEHRVTLGWNAKEFMVFVDQVRQSIHIEEITGGHLEVVVDDSLFEALLKFAQEKGFCDIMSPIIKPNNERFI